VASVIELNPNINPFFFYIEDSGKIFVVDRFPPENHQLFKFKGITKWSIR
jgi:hypothetical protein